MERKFTTTQKLILKNLCRKGKEITIIGINSFGQHFSTKGRIARDSKNRPFVDDDTIYVEFGKEKASSERNQTKWFASFELNMPRCKDTNCLAIESIYTESGKCIYYAEDFEEIFDIARNNRKSFNFSGNFNKLKLLDPVTSELKKLIGQPVTLKYGENEFCGVVEKVKGVDLEGNPYVELLDGCFENEVFIEENSKLYILDKNGEEKLKIESNPKIFNIAKENNKPVSSKTFEKTL